MSANAHQPAAPSARRPNRLIHEKSPYLLQHAYNPVDWYPWGEEAFAKARIENRPIFLSIGYSTCHWCHVMERESFEDDSVAMLLNRDFVAIKVDREERPDVDRLYMSSMQAMGMGGGWPLNAFLTPDLKPFFGGTYFPPRSVPGRIGMLELLPRVHEAWIHQREQIEHTGAQVFEALAAGTAAPDAHAAGAGAAAESLFVNCERSLAASYDEARGGFGGAPKFPSVVNLDFLWRWWALDPAGRPQARVMAMRQLDAMLDGGIHDHLGGGFHRYSTDSEWRVPHFEKMLYDQAQLASAYLDAWLATGHARYAAAARDVFGYVARDLSAPEGGFYSAEDADSEGEEGKFYVWTRPQVEAALPGTEAALFCDAYGVERDGKFEHGTS
ncbi:MAG: thioredoxin domain-containing protein, partial [Candidatus Eiseniibacteriota bacterium]